MYPHGFVQLSSGLLIIFIYVFQEAKLLLHLLHVSKTSASVFHHLVYNQTNVMHSDLFLGTKTKFMSKTGKKIQILS